MKHVDKWTKNPDWTWKTDLKYYLIVPFVQLDCAIQWLRKKELRDEFRFSDVLSLARSIVDMKLERCYGECYAKKVKK